MQEKPAFQQGEISPVTARAIELATNDALRFVSLRYETEVLPCSGECFCVSGRMSDYLTEQGICCQILPDEATINGGRTKHGFLRVSDDYGRVFAVDSQYLQFVPKNFREGLPLTMVVPVNDRAAFAQTLIVKYRLPRRYVHYWSDLIFDSGDEIKLFKEAVEKSAMESYRLVSVLAQEAVSPISPYCFNVANRMKTILGSRYGGFLTEFASLTIGNKRVEHEYLINRGFLEHRWVVDPTYQQYVKERTGLPTVMVVKADDNQFLAGELGRHRIPEELFPLWLQPNLI